jgi:hypothetical protein
MAALARTAVEGDNYAMLAAEFPDFSFQSFPVTMERRAHICTYCKVPAFVWAGEQRI